MSKNKISDFLTPDISYLLGLITGRGEIQSTNDVKKIVIDFQYKALEAKAITKTFDQKLHIQTSLDPIIYRLHNLGINTVKNVTDNNISVTLTWNTDDISWMFIKFLINGTRFNYHDFAIPEPILETTDDNKREFLRGLCDVTAYVRKSNNDQTGRNRVYIEISNRNWFLPAQLCQLLQSLYVPMQYIGWGHPNIRGGNGTSWAKEHQLKIYAEDFQNIGFYITHKNEALEELAEYNQENFSRPQNLCDGTITRLKTKTPHECEIHEKLPAEINGQHFDSFKQICKCLGCNLQNE
jgi:hypothetical protein